MREFIATEKELTVKKENRIITIEKSYENLNITSKLVKKIYVQHTHSLDSFSEKFNASEFEKNIDLINTHAKVDSFNEEWMVLEGCLSCHDLIRLFISDEQLIEAKMDKKININIIKSKPSNDSSLPSPIPSRIGINDGGKFNGIDYVCTPDDIPSLSLALYLLPEQYDYLEKQIIEKSTINVNIGVICFPEPSYSPPTEWFKDEIFLCDTEKYGIDIACITESITIINPSDIEKNEEDEIENNELHEDPIESPMNSMMLEIKEYLHSMNHDIHKLSKSVESGSKIYFWQILQGVLLAFIAWKLS